MVTIGPEKCWMESLGNQNSPGKLSWKSEKLRKSPGNVLELFFTIKKFSELVSAA